MSLLRRALHDRLARLREGRLSLVEGGTRRMFGAGGALTATLEVLHPRFYRAVAFGGHLGAAEAYMQGWWRCDDLTALVRLLVRNRTVLEGMERGWARALQPLRRLLHAIARNTLAGSRRNIAAHYDLGNDFFALFLDDTLTYSCGFFERPDATLREASVAKYDRLCRRLDLGPDEAVVEIGTGWGGFALHAAGKYGCRVTTTTISREQARLARERIAAAGLDRRVTVVETDYRALEGRFDALVSIEMIEAVGHAYYPTFFRRCAGLLGEGGRMALQAITIADRYYDAARREVDFIKRYIFPGSNIPSVAVLLRAMGRGSDLRLVHAEDITPHYAETLRRWRVNFFTNLEAIRALGYPEQFLRMWEFYLCYCEGGFEERHIGDVQMVFAKPGWRKEPVAWPS